MLRDPGRVVPVADRATARKHHSAEHLQPGNAAGRCDSFAPRRFARDAGQPHVCFCHHAVNHAESVLAPHKRGLAAQDDPLDAPRHDILAVLVRAAEVELYVRAVAAILNHGRGAKALHAIASEDWPVESEAHLLGQVVEVSSKLGRNGRRQEAVDDQPAVRIELDVVDPMIV